MGERRANHIPCGKPISRISALLRFSPVPRDVFCGLFFGWFLRRNLPAELGIKMSFKMSPELLAEFVDLDGATHLDSIPYEHPCGSAEVWAAAEALESRGTHCISPSGYLRLADDMRRVHYARFIRQGPACAFKRFNRKAGPWRGRRTVGPDGSFTEIAEMQP